MKLFGIFSINTTLIEFNLNFTCLLLMSTVLRAINLKNFLLQKYDEKHDSSLIIKIQRRKIFKIVRLIFDQSVKCEISDKIAFYILKRIIQSKPVLN